MASKHFDRYPQYKEAGFKNENYNDSTLICVQPQPPTTSTPKHIKKFRQSYRQQHGVIIEHPGLIDCQKKPENHIYGLQIKSNGQAKQLLNPKKEKIYDMKNEIFERKYASSQREPLAKSLSRNYALPAQVQDQNFEYGVRTIRNKVTTSEVLFPHSLHFKENPVNQKNYIKSHQTYEPGQQKDRNYSWNVDLKRHTFGKSTGVDNQIQNLIFKDNFNDKFPETKIISKNQEDFNNYKNEHIEKTANLFQVNQYQGKDSCFGRKLQRDEWDAYRCIKGNGQIDTHSSYNELGKTVKSGYRNITKDGDQDRIFGIPIHRNDLNKKTISLADPNNYGTEPNCIELIYPQKYSFMGLNQEDFENLKDKEEIKDIFSKVGVEYKIGKFEAIFIRAQQIQKNEKVSVKAFQKAVNEMHNQD